MIAHNLAIIKEKIAEAALRVGRYPEEIRIVAAAKGQGPEKVMRAIQAGIKIIGHNYLQEAARDLPQNLADDVQIHMIGHLQRNKAGKAVNIFHVIETVDNDSLASALSRRAQEYDKVIKVMIQVNLAKEPQKSGIEEEEVPRLVEYIRALPAIEIIGLMTIPPFFDEPERARPYFARLRTLQERLLASGAFGPEMKELSMGMSDDYEVAVEEGATLVRIGTALFGPRS